VGIQATALNRVGCARTPMTGPGAGTWVMISRKEVMKKMVMSLDEPIRQLLDGFAAETITMPVRVGVGNVYFVPGSDQGSFYVVANLRYTDKGVAHGAWICGCNAFRFGQQGDSCKHIRKVQDGLETKVKVTRRKKK
jgi:hypothetical protein